MSWASRFVDNARRHTAKARLLPAVIERQGMDRFKPLTSAQLLDVAVRASDDDTTLSMVCDVIRREKDKAVEGFAHAHRMRVSDGELRTIAGELCGVMNVEEVLMALIDKGRAERDRRARAQPKPE